MAGVPDIILVYILYSIITISSTTSATSFHQFHGIRSPRSRAFPGATAGATKRSVGVTLAARSYEVHLVLTEGDGKDHH